METIRIQTGATERITAVALSSALAPLTGLTDLLISIQRVSDGFWFDFADLTFKSVGWTTRQAAMTEISSTLAPGQYRTDFVTSTITNAAANDAYLITVTQSPGTTVKNIPQVGELKVGQWVDNLNATVSSRSTLTQAQVLSDATPFPGARIDAAITSRAAPGAAMDLVTDAVDAAALAADAVAEIGAALSSAHGAGSWEGSSASAVADAVWDEAIAGHSAAGSAGKELQDKPSAAAVDSQLSGTHGAGSWEGSSAAAVADAVWDELKAGHVGAGSFGEEVQSHATPTEVVTSLGTYGAATGAQVATRAAPGDSMDLITDAVDANALAASAITELDAALSAAHGAGSWEGGTPAAIADAVWDEAKAGHVAGGSFGEEVQSHATQAEILSDATPFPGARIDAAISSRAAPGAAMDLVTDAVDAAALATSAISEIDAALSAAHGAGSWEGSGASAVAAAVWDEPKLGHGVAGTFGAELQGKPSATEVAGAVWEEALPGGHPPGSSGERLATTDDRVDAAVSTRAAPGAAMTLTAGERVAVGAQADVQLSAAHGAGSWEGPSLGAVADAVWDEPLAGHAGLGTAGAELAAKAEPSDVLAQAGAALVAYGPATPADLVPIPAAVDAQLSGTHGAGSWQAPSAGLVAGAVWDEAAAGHAAPGSFGAEVQTHATPAEVRAQAVLALGDYDAADGADIAGIPGDVDLQLSALHGAGSWEDDPVALADAVWDEALAGHAGAGSAGKALEDARAAAVTVNARIPADPTSTVTEAAAHGATQAAVAVVGADVAILLARLTVARAAALDLLPGVASDAALTRRILVNRLELADGATNNWILYADDDVTPLLRFSVSDKDGEAIRLAKYVPARRTRGT